MSPYKMRILLHHFYTTEAFVGDAGGELHMELVEGGAFKISHKGFGSQFELTEKGKKWVAMILDTPMPINVWVDPRYDSALPISEPTI
jgi:hypothetical protein